VLGALIHADRSVITSRDPEGTELPHVAFVAGALGPAWTGADVLAYGATGGAGSAVVTFRIQPGA
ncbi:MAG: hypothetical protein AAGF45_12315, partial [Pseudomonadota bacterium]